MRRNNGTSTMRSAVHRIFAVDPWAPYLRTGDRLTQKQFHLLYEMTPPGFKAELIQGVVYVSSPAKNPHGWNHSRLMMLFHIYEANTPGVGTLIGPSLIVDDGNEPEPDAVLYIHPELGGQSDVTASGYTTGSPEMLGETSDSTTRRDLTVKRQAYQAAGVREYVVVNIPESKVHLFDLENELEIEPDAKGVLRSLVFPGLWIDTRSFFEVDSDKCLSVLNQGLKSPEHARFVKALAARRKKRKRSK